MFIKREWSGYCMCFNAATVNFLLGALYLIFEYAIKSREESVQLGCCFRT